MKTPYEKYMMDCEYRQFVDLLESFIHKAQFTPGEIREAAMLAAIHYEQRRPHPMMNSRIALALRVLDEGFTTRSSHE